MKIFGIVILLVSFFVAGPNSTQRQCESLPSEHGTLETTPQELPSWEVLGLNDLLVSTNEGGFEAPTTTPRVSQQSGYGNGNSFPIIQHTVWRHIEKRQTITPRCCKTYLYFLRRINQ